MTAAPESKTNQRQSVPKTIPRASSTEWQRPLSKTMLAQIQDATPVEIWRMWRTHLASRSKVLPLLKLLPNSKSPLGWSVDISLQRDTTLAFIAELAALSSSKKKGVIVPELLHKWSLNQATDVFDSIHAIECVAVAWSLPALSQFISADLWWSILDHLAFVAADTLQLDLENQPIAANLVGGELPMVLAYLFPELKTATGLSSLGIEFLSDTLVEMLDGEGMPKARYLPYFRPLLGCWTRCRAVMKQQKPFLWSDDAENQFRWLVTQAIRLSRGQGGFAFASGDHRASDRDLLLSAVTLFGTRSDMQAAQAVLGRKNHPTTRSMDEPSYHSTWAGVGVLRSKFHKKSRLLSVVYDECQQQIELSYGRHVLFKGEISSQTVLQNRNHHLSPSGTWDEIAWESDEEVDYLEIETKLNQDTKLQRSFLLSRKDHFLLLADTILSEQKGLVTHQLQLPLGSEMNVDFQTDTWELLLKGPQALARILPLGLAEWRSGCHNGKLSVKRQSIQIEQIGESRMFIPLFIDLSPKRAPRTLTWRQLSVGEKRKNLPSNVAAGFRVQIANEHWLIYRSLERTIPRTILGQNLLCEYHVSRFRKSGATEPLIEIQ